MSYVTLRALLMATVAAAVIGVSPNRARAWTECYGGLQDCQCYVPGWARAYEAPYGGYWDEVGVYPTPPIFAGAKGNNTTYNECAGHFSSVPYGFGQHWLAASACSQYPSSDFAGWIVEWYWEGSYQDTDAAPWGWYTRAANSLPYYCCSELGVCN